MTSLGQGGGPPSALLGHGDPIAPVLIVLVLIAVAAALGGRAMQRLGQPAVLGELLVGIVVANLGYYVHSPVMTVLREGPAVAQAVNAALTHNLDLSEAVRQLLPASPESARLAETLSGPAAPVIISIYEFIDLLSRIAIIVLLFLAGLETSIHEMRKVGRTAFWVAVIGVAGPFLLGSAAMVFLEPQATAQAHLFVGGILTATSVAITARVFRDLRESGRIEAKVILGAAVIDDVLGLIVLAVMTGLVATGRVNLENVAGITAKALLFLVGSIGVGLWMTPRLYRRIARLGFANLRLLFGLGFAFLLAWLANRVGLATIVGAFAAGLVLEQLFSHELEEKHSLRELLTPLEALIVPLFFVLMGMQVKLETFAHWQTLWMALLLTAAAIVGKLLSGLACGRSLDRLSVGIGMTPRGEVGLIFASIGRGLGVVNDAIFSAVVLVVILTTLLAPSLLRVRLAGRAQARAR